MSIQKQNLPNEVELVKQAIVDDRAFSVLYDFYFPQIYGYLYKRLGCREIVEDLVSEIFLKVFSNLKSFDSGKASFSTWLYRIATNRLVDFYRKHGREKSLPIDDDVELTDEINFEMQVSAQFDAKVERQLVDIVLRKLNKRYQRVLHLRFFAEMDNSEIAATCQISINNVGVLLHRAQKKFEKLYQKYAK